MSNIVWFWSIKPNPHNCYYIHITFPENFLRQYHTSSSRSWGSISESDSTAILVTLQTSWSPGSLPTSAFCRIKISHHGKSETEKSLLMSSLYKVLLSWEAEVNNPTTTCIRYNSLKDTTNIKMALKHVKGCLISLIH